MYIVYSLCKFSRSKVDLARGKLFYIIIIIMGLMAEWADVTSVSLESYHRPVSIVVFLCSFLIPPSGSV